MQGGMKKSQKSIFLPIFRPISEMIQNSQECSREYLFDHNNDEVQQLRSKKRMKMINKSNEMLLAGAERNNNSDPLPWNAPQWHPSSSRHQLMTLLYHLLRLMMLLKIKDVNHAASPTILENARHHSTTYSHHDLRAAPFLQIHNVSKT